jgi:hypothetical protein
MRAALLIALLGTLAANAAPPALRSPSAAYDERRGRLVVYGGSLESGVAFADTWEWDGVTWRHVATSGPPARSGAGMVYDARRETVVLFGGVSSINPERRELGDTWEWNGTQWTQVASTGPSPRTVPQMAYDRARGRVVLFGGFGANAQLGDTWEWNGTAWESLAVTGPPARALAGFAYDEKRGVTVLFGGDRGFTPADLLRDTWTFDGRTWTDVTTTDGPSARDHVSMGYDPALERLILFGGGDFEEGGAWQWNGAEWQVLTATGPSKRDVPSLVTDRAGGRLLMYGGRWDEVFNELWVLSCDRWSLTAP